MTLAFIVVGCGRLAAPPPSGVASASASIASPTEVAWTWSDLLLDTESRRLLTVLDEGERVRADIDTDADVTLVAAARAAGLDATAGAGGSASLTGEPNRILALLVPGTIRGVSLGEDRSALRWIPDARPEARISFPGRPYLFAAVPANPSDAHLPSDQGDVMLSGLARLIQTIDGRPYVSVELSGGCDRDDGALGCRAGLVGVPMGGVQDADWWAVVASERTGWAVALEPGSPTLTGVPRRVLRSAEWIARHDPGALERIQRYTTCCTAWWEVGAPGRITLWYTRDCSLSAVPTNRDVADTGDCVDGLEIVVDVGSGAVVRFTEHPGP